MQSNKSISFLVSWADMITLLLVFFIYLYSISDLDISKFLQAQESMNKEFNLQASNSFLKDFKTREKKLQELKSAFIQSIEVNQLTKHVTISQQLDYLEINLTSKILFESGSASLINEAQYILEHISELLAINEGQIIIEGHTDNQPIKTLQFPSNWELSSARAAAVARYFTSLGIAPHRLQTVGYGEHRPVSDNHSPENRAKNRRIKILIKYDFLSDLQKGPSDAQ